MELLLARTDRGSESTSGNLSVSDEGGDRVCHTIEDRIRTGPKVHGETAIPTGRFRVGLRTDSPKFQHYYERWDWYRGIPHIQSVPEFTWIYMHPGLDHRDSHGCVLVGFDLEEYTVYDKPNHRIRSGTTRPAFEKVCKMIYAELDRGEEVWITITDPDLE
jgi:hypothetical protein|tara:strand:- start:4451 stop:4933 length:483 start_codon:yes stop_codon:yes gene_type:complete